MDQQKYSRNYFVHFQKRRNIAVTVQFKLRKQKIHQNPPKLLLLEKSPRKNRHLDVGLQERGSKRLGSGLHLGVAWKTHQQSGGFLAEKYWTQMRQIIHQISYYINISYLGYDL